MPIINVLIPKNIRAYPARTHTLNGSGQSGGGTAGFRIRRHPGTNLRLKGHSISFALSSFLAVAFSVLFYTTAWAQSAASADQPPAILPLASEATPKITAYAPLAEPLSRGVVIIQYRTENVRIMPVFGKQALAVSPRLGHLHVTVDDWHGAWAHTSEDPIIVNGLAPGPHKILLEVADPTHHILTSTTVNFIVPMKKNAEPHSH